MTEHRMLVGMDGSPAAVAAMCWAARHAHVLGADVLVVVALDPNVEFVRDLPPIGFSNWRTLLRTELRTKWVEPLRTAGVSFETRLIEGSPAEVLMATATAESVDLIVIGTHGRGGIGGHLIGSVSYAVTRRAKRPVVVVPATWVEDPAEQQGADS